MLRDGLRLRFRVSRDVVFRNVVVLKLLGFRAFRGWVEVFEFLVVSEH